MPLFILWFSKNLLVVLEELVVVEKDVVVDEEVVVELPVFRK